jgi:hypothetical protein
MKKHIMFLVVLSMLIFALAGISHAWQGRMGGMGDPYGLVVDESDFLIHPAKIAKGEGVKLYGDYRFTYTGVMTWDSDLNYFNPAGVLTAWDYIDMSGAVFRHDVLVGAAFPLGPGRMGLFFTYEGERGGFDGDWEDNTPPAWTVDEVRNDLDAFALSLFYGLPAGGLNLGGEVQFAYRGEEQKNYGYQNDWTNAFSNEEMFGGFLGIFPYDSQYWETLLKGSLEASLGPADVEFALRGGFIFAGDNGWEYEIQAPAGTPTAGWDLEGGVDGWRIGGDLWVRYPVDSLTLPFLVRIDYQAKTRDGDGEGTYGWAGDQVDYDNQEQTFALTVGGGVDKEIAEGTRIAGGLYYNYLQSANTFSWHDAWPGGVYDMQDLDLPDVNEHQVMLRLAGEHAISPEVSLRAGLNLFYGWVQWDGSYYYYRSGRVRWENADLSMSGYRWGIGGSVGSTVRFNGFALEPFVSAGYQQLSLDGGGEWLVNGTLTDILEGTLDRGEWYISGGLSVLFDIP